jgi:hypothetical protein
MSRRISSLLAVFALCLPFAKADIIPPDTKIIEHTILFTGIKAHAEKGLRFVAFPLNWSRTKGDDKKPDFQLLEEGSKLNVGYRGSPQIYVITDAKLELKDLTLEWFDAADRVKSKDGYAPNRFASESDPVAKRTTTYKIARIEGKELIIEVAKDEKLNSAGEPISMTQQGLAYAGLPAMAVLALASVIMTRRRRAAA